MEQKETLTNENLFKKYKNQFDLVNTAIKLAEHAIKSGREPIVRAHSQNIVLDIIEEITASPAITSQDMLDNAEFDMDYADDVSDAEPVKKAAERKKKPKSVAAR